MALGLTPHRLTPHEEGALRFIEGALKDRGVAPAVREICVATGIRGAQSITNVLGSLERKGFIARRPRQARAIEVLQPTPKISAHDHMLLIANAARNFRGQIG